MAFIHEFMEEEGIPVQRTSRECMQYLQEHGYSVNVARGILGRAVAQGFIIVTAKVPVKTYN